MKKILLIILCAFLGIQAAISAPMQGQAKTKRIPAGTKFSLQLMTPVETSVSKPGADFSALLINDHTADADVILPGGSLVRGNIAAITLAKRLSRGAILYMDFDHVVRPNGRQLPLSMQIVGRSDLTFDGGITTTRGYGDAMKQDWEKSKNIAKGAYSWGNDNFEDVAGGFVRIVTVPVGVIGGGLGAGGYAMYSSVADLIKKGKNVSLKKGDIINVILVQPIDVPVI